MQAKPSPQRRSLDTEGPVRNDGQRCPRDTIVIARATADSRAEDARDRAARGLESYEFGGKICKRHEASRQSLPNDAWGTPFRVRCDLKEMNYVFTSAGADRTFGTQDDLHARHMSGAVSVFREVK